MDNRFRLDGEKLYEQLKYSGMVRAVRELAVTDKLAPVEDIAIMGTDKVCCLVSQKYKMVFAAGEDLGLVRREDLPAYNKLVHMISR